MSEMFISQNITELNFYNAGEDTKIAAAVEKIIIRFEAIRWTIESGGCALWRSLNAIEKREYA